MSTSVAMKPWSPAPCTVGAKRITDDRTPRSARPRVRCAFAIRGWALGSGRSSSVPTRPGDSPRRAGGDHQRAVRAGQGVAKSFDRPPVGFDRAREISAEREVVPERKMDDTVRLGRGCPQDIQIVQAAAQHRGARRSDGRTCLSERARPTTSCPAFTSCSAVGAPIQPEAPVTKMRMRSAPFRCQSLTSTVPR